MPYFVRVFSPSTTKVLQKEIVSAARDLGASVTVESNNESWPDLLVATANGSEVCVIEQNEVLRASPAKEEIAEFRVEIANCSPVSAVEWLNSYFDSVRQIYAFQVLSGVYNENGWDVLSAVIEKVKGVAGGIVQADREGFSNEDGDQILWQFPDDVEGEWSMAILKNGLWTQFDMDLGNADHRKAFKAGEVPHGLSTSS